MNRTELLKSQLTKRILILDGAMGTMIQSYKLDEAGFRGKRFADHPHDLKGDNDLLSLSRPEIVREIHDAYLEAGADLFFAKPFDIMEFSAACCRLLEY